MSRAPLRLAAAAFCAALPLLAAADTTAEQAAALRKQLRDWIAHLLPPGVAVPDKLIDVTPEGDHFRATVSLEGLAGATFSQGGTFAASAHPAEGGRWTIDNLQVASPTKLTITPPSDKGEPAKPADMTVTIAKYTGKGVLDPSLASASSFDAKLEGYDATADTAKAQNHTHIDSIAAQASLTPAANGKFDFLDTASAENYSSTSRSGDLPQFDVAAQHVHVKLRVDALDGDRALGFFRAMGQLIGLIVAVEHENAEHHTKQQIDTKALRDFYVAFRGLASGAEVSETIEGVRISAAGHIVGLERLGIGGGVSSPGGVLAANLAFDLGGVSSADIPPDVREYVPHHLTIKPTISGISLNDLDALIMAATASDSEKQDMNARVAALFSHGGIVVGLDALEFDLGPATLSATGKLTARSPSAITVVANVKASGLDALILKAQSAPELAQGVPPLAIARSLAEPQGKDLVWAVRYENGAVTINGKDLSALFGSKKGGAEEK